jgi:WD40 repeat protein
MKSTRAILSGLKSFVMMSLILRSLISDGTQYLAGLGNGRMSSGTFGGSSNVFAAHGSPVTCLAAAAAGNVFVSGGEDCIVRIWNVKS